LVRNEEDRREEILAATVRCVSRDGIDGATIRRIADEAGVSSSLVLYYFNNRDDLLSEAWNSALRHFRTRATEMVGDSKGVNWMEALYRVLFVERDDASAPWSFWLHYWAKAALTPNLRQHHSDRFAQLRGLAANHAQASIEQGQFRSDFDPLLVGDLFYTLIYGLAVEVTLDPESVPPERAMAIARFMLSLLDIKEKGSD
jgi:AcrR family transcriptional regulator